MKERTMRRPFGPWILVAVIPFVVNDVGPNAPARHALARTVWDSVYSASQAARGETSYVKSCARCHRPSLSGADESPPLTGSGFLGNWNGLPLSDLQDRIRKSMPSDSVGIYDRQLVTDVMAYILKVNGFPAGASDLPSSTDGLKDIMLQSAKP